jgi:uncharacterized protein
MMRNVMTEKAGRNDPCPCGSGKKYKSCCWTKQHTKRKLTAKWLNQPQPPDLIHRTFGKTSENGDQPSLPFAPWKPKVEESSPKTEENQTTQS